MSARTVSRREFLYVGAMTAAGAALAACQPQTVVVKETVEVEKVVKETVEVEKEKVIEKEKVVTATPVVSSYREAPALAGMAQSGALPLVDERLSGEPKVIEPVEEVGQYGGTWHRMASGPNDINMTRMNYCCLARFNNFGTELVPDVAVSWEVNADSSVYTFNLRKGMKWSDGAPYGADDWVYYMDDHVGNDEISPGKPSALRPHGELATLEKVDDFTIRFDFHGPYAFFTMYLPQSWGVNQPNYPAHYLKQFHIKYADKAGLEATTKEAGFEQWYQLYGDKNGMETNVERPSIWAWQIDQPAPKQPIVAARNPYYWKIDTDGNQLPYIDRIEWMVVTGGDVVNLRAASGEVDMQLRHITFENYPIFKENEEAGDYRVLEWLWGENEIVVGFTQDSVDPVKKPILEDKRFRFALSLAVDRQEICDAIYFGTVEPSQLVPYETSPWWTEERANFMAAYDPDRANAYLDEMGLTERDVEGYRLMPDGNRLIIFWDYAPIFGPWGPTGELVREHYAKIGVDLQLKEQARQLFYERFRARETELVLWTGHASFLPILTPRNYAAIHYGGTKWAAQYGLWWETGGVDGIEPPPDSDIRKTQLLYDKVLTAPTMEEAYAIFDELLDVFYDNLWAMGFTTPPIQPVIVKNSFRNVPDGVLATNTLQSPGSTAPEQYFFRQG
jgi:peptide/nickel transport system substrate-binding protein